MKQNPPHLLAITLLSLWQLINVAWAASKSESESALEQEIATHNQDLRAYLKLTAESIATQTTTMQKHDAATYLAQYFSPWSDPYRWHSAQEIQSHIGNIANTYLTTPRWGLNRQLINKHWLQSVIDNMDFADFPNAGMKAMIVQETNLRYLPTQLPIYDDWKKAGQGYPFDGLQNSYLYFNTPAYILQTTRDKAWHLLILGDASFGWVPATSVVTVSAKIAARYRHLNKEFITPTATGLTLLAKNKRFIAQTHLGQIYPLHQVRSHHYEIQVIVDRGDGRAQLQQILFPKQSAVIFPREFINHTIATVGNALQHIPYGWGGMHGLLDCSQLMRDVFASFAIWLPRNAIDQATYQHNLTLLQQLTPKEKIAHLKQHARPFRTLIYLPGHIGLYLGYDRDKLYMFHSRWGLKTWDSWKQQEGRIVIGRSLVTTLDLGAKLPKVQETWLDQAIGYRNL